MQLHVWLWHCVSLYRFYRPNERNLKVFFLSQNFRCIFINVNTVLFAAHECTWAASRMSSVRKQFNGKQNEKKNHIKWLRRTFEVTFFFLVYFLEYFWMIFVARMADNCSSGFWTRQKQEKNIANTESWSSQSFELREYIKPRMNLPFR